MLPMAQNLPSPWRWRRFGGCAALGASFAAIASWGQAAEAQLPGAQALLEPEPAISIQSGPGEVESSSARLQTGLRGPSSRGAVIAAIHVRDGSDDRVTKGGKPHAGIVQLFNLQPGDVYGPAKAQADLAQATALSTSGQATLTLEPAAEPDQVVMVVTVDKPNAFFYGFGNLPRPTALPGPVRPSTVRTASNRARGIAIRAYAGFDHLGGNNQRLTLGAVGGANALGAELDFRQFYDNGSGYGVNFENRRGVEPEFDGGEVEVDTPGGDDPWVHRLGGGAEYFRPLAPDLEAALGVSYQRVSVRDDVFTSDIVPSDGLGNALTVSDSGQDDLLTVNFSGNFDRRNDPQLPTQGFRLLFGMDQSIPIGDADILFNRLSANYSHYIPLDLFGFTAGPRTLALNLQGGTIIGDAPPYESFSLGGSSSVRGYSLGELGTGKSYLQATAEYRFPAFSFNALRQDVDVGGTLFFDYATDLGTGDDVIGEPAEARDKPGEGFGYGLGIRAVTSVGVFRAEFGISDEGESQFTFSIGDRF